MAKAGVVEAVRIVAEMKSVPGIKARIQATENESTRF
jgi:hypothetical protein